MSDLLPCPFCGGTASISSVGDPDSNFYVECDGCGIEIKNDCYPEMWFNTKQEAAGAWNTRSDIHESYNQALREALEKAGAALEIVQYELAGLIPDPGNPTIIEWPCEREADRECLFKAYIAAIDLLDSKWKFKIPALSTPPAPDPRDAEIARLKAQLDYVICKHCHEPYPYHIDSCGVIEALASQPVAQEIAHAIDGKWTDHNPHCSSLVAPTHCDCGAFPRGHDDVVNMAIELKHLRETQSAAQLALPYINGLLNYATSRGHDTISAASAINKLHSLIE